MMKAYEGSERLLETQEMADLASDLHLEWLTHCQLSEGLSAASTFDDERLEHPHPSDDKKTKQKKTKQKKKHFWSNA